MYLIGFIIMLVLLLGAISVYRHKVDIVSSLMASIAIMMTHISYGIFFVKGLLTRHLDR